MEIAELVSDAGFRQRTRQTADIARQVNASQKMQDWLDRAQESAVAAVLRGCPPDSAEAAQVVHHILEPAEGDYPLNREEMVAGLEVFTDPRIERYWHLTATVNAWLPFPSHNPASTWLLAALRASK